MLLFKALLVGAIAQLTAAHPKAADAKLGAVASESSVCTKIGINILKKGGNAADSVSNVNPLHR